MRLPRLMLIALLSVLPVACGSTAMLRSVPACSRLVSASGLLEPTPGADIPDPPAEAAEAEKKRAWQAGFNSQSGQLQKANDDKGAAGRVMTECESMHREALARATRPLWKFW